MRTNLNMIKTLIFSISLISSFSAFSQGNDSLYLKFDSDVLKKLTDCSSSYYLEDSTRVQIQTCGEEIQEIRTPHNSLYSWDRRYYKYGETKTLKTSGEFFQGAPIGVHKLYDKTGALVVERNYNVHFTFTLKDVALKMKKEFNLDIMDTNQNISISGVAFFDSRYIFYYVCPPPYYLSDPDHKTNDSLKNISISDFMARNPPYYNIRYPLIKNGKGGHRLITIDGRSGIILANRFEYDRHCNAR